MGVPPPCGICEGVAGALLRMRVNGRESRYGCPNVTSVLRRIKGYMRETTAAAGTETSGFAVGVGNVERRIHDAERVGTMRKPRRMPQFVHRLLDCALQQSLFVATPSDVKSAQ